MKDINVYLRFFGLSELWWSSFTEDERQYVESSILFREKKEDFGRSCLYSNSGSKVDLIGHLIVAFSNKGESSIFLKLCEEIESVDKAKVDLYELHKYYSNKICVLNKNINNWPGIYKELKKSCYKQIEISASVAHDIKKGKGEPSLYGHVGFKRLSIILEKEKRYSEVVDICRKALKEGWLGDWEKRIYRNDGKNDKPIRLHNTRKLNETKRYRETKSSISALNSCFLSVDGMNSEQRSYYKDVELSLNNAEYFEVGGNVGYVFVYIYDLISQWDRIGFECLRERLSHLAELYIKEKSISDYCNHWSNDCLLGGENYIEYLEKTKPGKILKSNSNASNIRINVQKHIGMEANDKDVFSLFDGRRSRFIKENESLYMEKLVEVLKDYSASNGGWFSILEEWSNSKRLLPYYLFPGAPVPRRPTMAFELREYASIGKNIQLIKDLSKAAENKARTELGVPPIGSGWLSETMLFNKLKTTFPNTDVVQHGQPRWLGQQHYDIWFPEWKLAVEYHGIQHFKPVDFFGGKDALSKTVERDKRKIRLSETNGVYLIIVEEGYDYTKLVDEINNAKNDR